MANATLEPADIERRLAEVSQWETREDMQKLARAFSFPSFAQAMAFVNAVADLAERENHHPDIHVSGKEVTFEIWTHSAGGITDKDFALAGKIDALAME